MTDPSLISRHSAKALALLGLRPKGLAKTLELAAEFENESSLHLKELATHLETASVNDATRLMFHEALATWDGLAAPDWAGDTSAQTKERRSRIYSLLEVGEELASIFDQLFPPHIAIFPEFTISRQFERWFDAEEQEAAGFYWPKYRQYLGTVEDWPPASTASLARASAQVVERLANPSKAQSDGAARGLVVGFVQSGKTANFTGVIARAVDAGYRLIVVLTGTTNLLREQTQRRLDKQLIGKEALLGLAGAADEYEDAPDWDRFIEYGQEPGVLGAPNWVRLTNLEHDYLRLGIGPGLEALRFEHPDETKPLGDPANLQHMKVRLVVAKKNRAPLTSLAKDLRKLKEAGVAVEDIPTLIIDDESDQASINTKKPTKKELERRTSINAAIADLLSILKRAQYVGYTATPFANVFVDPNDDLGIFPRDFIVSLERPIGYMGASDYHDFGEERTGFESNERAYVRAVYGDDGGPENLLKAIDCFLLAGAIKLYRAAEGAAINCRHHTMLVHTSQRTADHAAMATTINDLVESGGYLDGSADARLETLFTSDFRPVHEAKGADLPFPSDYDSCRPFFGECIDRLERGPDRVLIVNGLPENEPMSPDFDRDDIWKIIVGGTKLSRGYTVEGLTVSYYRRAARAADTLMQMGRWFGFRRGYMDLMRLFVGRAEGKTNPLDLYGAFEAICRDELDFRNELLRYALPTDGSDPITPMQVPPLVTQNLPDIAPTAKNKMYNAVIQSQNFGGKPIARTLAPKERVDMRANQALARTLMTDVEVTAPILGAVDDSFASLVAQVEPARVLTFLEHYRWSRPGVLDRALAFLNGELGDTGIARWVLVWPLLEKASDHGTWPLDGHRITVIERFRQDNGRFGVYTTPAHVRAARMLALEEDIENATPDTQALVEPGTAVALMYAVKGKYDKDVSIGFYLLPPQNSIRDRTVWGVRVKEAEDEPIVDVPVAGG